MVRSSVAFTLKLFLQPLAVQRNNALLPALDLVQLSNAYLEQPTLNFSTTYRATPKLQSTLVKLRKQMTPKDKPFGRLRSYMNISAGMLTSFMTRETIQPWVRVLAQRLQWDCHKVVYGCSIQFCMTKTSRFLPYPQHQKELLKFNLELE